MRARPDPFFGEWSGLDLFLLAGVAGLLLPLLLLLLTLLELLEGGLRLREVRSLLL